MVPVKEPAGTGFKILTVLTVLFFLALVAGLITTYNRGSDVAARPAATTAAAAGASSPEAASPGAAIQAPVGAVATGGGGMAGDGAGMALPIVVGLVVLTMLATTGIVLRRQEA